MAGAESVFISLDDGLLKPLSKGWDQPTMAVLSFIAPLP
ncbi:hypothetical protein GFS31_04180 [Leptolyngbya sp. BL0902]|nr:hypothetical protein GFS31_04180 [Leptolyngbya sp. BL0902]